MIGRIIGLDWLDSFSLVIIVEGVIVIGFVPVVLKIVGASLVRLLKVFFNSVSILPEVLERSTGAKEILN